MSDTHEREDRVPCHAYRTMMRYTYLGDRLSAPELRGLQCDPLRDERGKCVRGANGNALVVDSGGVRYVVVGRRLRLNKEEQE